MEGSLIIFIISNKKFSTPDRPIIAIPGPIECNSDYRMRSIQLILSHACSDVSMMVLNTDHWQFLTFTAL